MNKITCLILAFFATLLVSCEKLERKTGIKTGDAENIQFNRVKLNGEIGDLGSSEARQYGFCLSQNNNPGIYDSIFETGRNPVVGKFTSEISGLKPATNYFYRAFIEENGDFFFGETKHFTTLSAPLPNMAISGPLGLTHNQAIVTGNIVSGNGDSVSISGICWNTQPNPTMDQYKKENLTASRQFTDTITGLESATVYYFRAYGINMGGVGYSQTLTFTTSNFIKPEALTDSANHILDNEATCYGNIVSEGEGPIISCGICYSLNPEPGLRDSMVTTIPAVGHFLLKLTGLSNNSTYYYRAFAKNEGGTGFGVIKSFQTKSPMVIPSVGIFNAEAVNYATTRVGGVIYGDGGGISEYGICYSETNYYPDINDDIVLAEGNYSLNQGFYVLIDYLRPSTHYNFRTFARNSAGTAYSQVEGYTTPAGGFPTVSSIGTSKILATSALIVGKEEPLMYHVPGVIYGVCWNTTGNPSLSDHIVDTISTSLKYFECKINGLQASTTYYVKPFAKNANGTGYGDEISFTTKSVDEIVTDFDGNEYATVSIGNQVWLRDNLRSAHYSDGTPVPEYQIYGNKEGLEQIYGYLYSQADATRNTATEMAQGVCPSGYHLPSNDEWETLIQFTGGFAEGANKLKEQGDIHWLYQNQGTDDYSFSATGAGVMRNGAVLMNLREHTYFWTSTLFYGYNKAIGLSGAFDTFSWGSLDSEGVTTYVSVRCVKNNK